MKAFLSLILFVSATAFATQPTMTSPYPAAVQAAADKMQKQDIKTEIKVIDHMPFLSSIEVQVKKAVGFDYDNYRIVYSWEPVWVVSVKSKDAAETEARILANNIKTEIRMVENTEGNPCMPEGRSYQVDLLVNVETTWAVAKTIGVSLDGKVMDFCAE